MLLMLAMILIAVVAALAVVLWPGLSRRVAFTLEFLLIIVPYGIAILGFAIILVTSSFSISAEDVLISASIAMALMVPYACGLRLSIAYLSGERQGLLGTHGLWWWGAYAGALVPAAGLAALVLRFGFGNFAIEPISASPEEQPFGPSTIETVMVGLVAIPLLLPLWHLHAVRRSARAA